MSVDTKRIGIWEARARLAELTARARYKGETFLIAKHGEPLALLIPISSIPTLQPLQSTSDIEPLTPAQKKFGALARMMRVESKT